MPRKPTGQIIETPTADGDVAVAVRVPFQGKRPKVTLGNKSEGWTREKAQEEVDNILADIRRGLWTPPSHKPPPPPQPDGSETFHEFASAWYRDGELEWSEKTRTAYKWALSNHLLPTFKDMALSEIRKEDVDAYAKGKLREREKKGRGLSNNSINYTLYILSQILDVAVEYERIARNPAKGKRRRLKGEEPKRPVVYPEQLLTLLSVCDSTLRPLVAMLGGAGLRISEAVALRWSDLDLAAGTVRVKAGKTSAAARTVDMPLGLADEMRAWKARSKATRPTDAVFRKKSGGPQSVSNAQDRLSTAVGRANRKLPELKIGLIPSNASPHALRRGYASLRCYLDRDLAYVMEQLGHAESGVTLDTYAKALKRRDRMSGKTLEQFDAACEWAERARSGTSEPVTDGHRFADRIPEPFEA